MLEPFGSDATLDDHALGRRTMARVSWRILPLLLAAALVAGIDRFNVGFAALSMNAALGLSPKVYALGSSIFFLGFFLFELPSNLLLATVGARRWLTRIMISWGVVVMLLAAAQGPKTFVGLRLLLGIAEAGFAPGVLYFLSRWFPDRYRARVAGLIVLSVPLSSAISGPIAAAILPLNGALGLAGWQWLFILEGLPAILIGFAFLALLAEAPDRASWLPERERTWLSNELGVLLDQPHSSKWREFRPALADPRTWALAIAFLLFGMGLPNLNIWLPTLLKQGGYGVTAIGWLSSIPFVASVSAMLLIARHSDRSGERTWHIVAPLLVAAAGFACSALPVPIISRVTAMAVGYIGLTGALPVFWTLPPRFLSGRAVAAGIGTISAVGNLGTFAGGAASGLLMGPNNDFSRPGLLFACSALLGAGIILGVQREAVTAARRQQGESR